VMRQLLKAAEKNFICEERNVERDVPNSAHW
jgi:hypothetical protein